MADTHKNFAYSTVATAPSPATSGTSLVVAAGQGALFPAVPFNAVIWPVSVNPTAANAEIVRVTLVSTDTLTIVRQKEGTSARTVVVGDQITAAITAKILDDVDKYEEVTGTTKQMVANVRYGANNAGLVTFTLPATVDCLVGDTFEVDGIGAGGWKIAQNASQLIHFGDTDSLTGTGGFIASTHRRDCVILKYVAANEFQVIDSIGNITINIS